MRPTTGLEDIFETLGADVSREHPWQDVALDLERSTPNKLDPRKIPFRRLPRVGD